MRLRMVLLLAKRQTKVKVLRSTLGPMRGTCSRSRSPTAAK